MATGYQTDLGHAASQVEHFAKSCRRTPIEELRLAAVRTIRFVSASAYADDVPAGWKLMETTRLYDKIIQSVVQGVERIKGEELAQKARAAIRAEMANEGAMIHTRRAMRFRELYQAQAGTDGIGMRCEELRAKLEKAVALAFDCWRGFGVVDHIALADTEGREGLADLDFMLTQAISGLTGAKYAVSLARKLAE